MCWVCEGRNHEWVSLVLHLFSDWLRRDEREDAELRGKSVLGSDWSREELHSSPGETWVLWNAEWHRSHRWEWCVISCLLIIPVKLFWRWKLQIKKKRSVDDKRSCIFSSSDYVTEAGHFYSLSSVEDEIVWLIIAWSCYRWYRCAQVDSQCTVVYSVQWWWTLMRAVQCWP